MDYPVLLGNSLEFGFKLAIAEDENAKTDCQIEDIESAKSLIKSIDEEFEKLGGYVKLREILLSDKLTVDKFIDVFAEIDKIIQSRRVKKINANFDALNVDKKLNIFRIFKIGYQIGLAFLDYIRQNYDEYTIVLEPEVCHNGISFKPDITVFDNDRLELIGDVKSYTGFAEEQINLYNHVEQFGFRDFDVDEICGDDVLWVWQFKKLVTVIQKYWYVLNYVKLCYDYFEDEMFPLRVCLVLPGAVSVINLENYLEYLNLRENLKRFVPKKVKSDDDIRDVSKYIDMLLPEPGKKRWHVKTLEYGRDTYYYITNGEEKEYIGFTYFEKSGEPIQKGWIKEIKISESIDEKRKKHAEKFLELLSEEYNLIINGSEQGIGKTHTIREFAKVSGYRILIFCPRKRLIEEIKSKLESEGISVKVVFAERERELEKNRTYYDMDIIYESSSRKLRKALEKGIEQVILVTSQTLPYFLRSKIGLKLIFSRIDCLVFDELTNSEPAVRESFLRILKEFSRRKQEQRLKMIVVTDASITSISLFKNVLESHLNSKFDCEYTPFQVLKKEDQQFLKFNINGLKCVYFKETIDFNMNIGCISCLFDEKTFIPNWNLVIGALNDLFNECKPPQNFEDYLKEGKVLFYVDNKIWIDSLSEFLAQKQISAETVHAEITDEIDKSKNIIGTSSLAFGTSFPEHDVLVVFPPYFDVKYFNDIRYIEHIRQVIKRLRGKDDALKFVVLCAFTRKQENVDTYYYQLRHFIENILTNRNYHICVPYYSGKKSAFVVFGERDTKRKREVMLEVFLRDYMPTIKRLFQSSGFSIKEYFIIKFNEKQLWNDIPSISLLLYPLEEIRLAKDFTIRLRVIDRDALKKLKENLRKDSYRTARNYLAKILKTDPIEFVERFSNPYAFAKAMESELNPEFMFSSNSTVLASLDIVSDKEPDEYFDALISKGSPLKNMFFGDSKYFESVVNILIRLRDVELHTVGFLCYHPQFCADPPLARKVIKLALSKEIFKEDKLILPHFTKLKSLK